MNRRVLLGITGWLAVAASATAAGVAAIDVLEGGITGRSVRPLDEDAVHRALGRTGGTSPAAPPSPSPSASATGGVTRSLGTGGGTVTARCAGGKVTIVAVTPAQGFHTDGFARGPAPSVTLKLESDEKEYGVTVACEGGSPVARSTTDDGHHGGRRGRG
ncbi:hypothetical protein [Actinoallomurus iriomotensis]|uniref:Septum formation initiator n=1 Tax=Actinoallomurus iriomotensis TaxID=478107 RepID=A0A9W6SDT9_9ACTN|nr:hypothetical protein [Actinoallomurus iriomotensis]GLY91769.1 hypothetical protein Airi02_096970 [Actinoallomurus iriomotensis]